LYKTFGCLDDKSIYNDLFNELLNFYENSSVVLMKKTSDGYEMVANENNFEKINNDEIKKFYEICYEESDFDEDKPVIIDEKNRIIIYPIYFESNKLCGKIAILTKLNNNSIFLKLCKTNIEARIRESYRTKCWEMLFNNSLSGIVVYEVIENGENFIIKYFNKKAEEIENINSKKIIGKKVTDVFTGIIEMGLFDEMKKVYEIGESIYYPISFYKDKRIKGYRENYIHKLFDNEIIIFYNDLTNEKIKENELIATKERYELAINENNLGLWDWDIITDYVEVNNNFLDIVEITDNNPLKIMKAWKDKIFDEDIENVEIKLKNYVKNQVDHFEIKYRIKTKNGFKWVSNEGEIIKWEDGKAIRMIGVCKDITERIMLEEEIKRKNNLFQQLFDESNESIALLDEQANIIQVNRSFEKLFLYKNDNIVGLKIDNLILPEELNYEGKNYSDEVIKGKDIKTECIRKNKNNERINVSLHAFQIKLGNGEIGIYAIYNDISKRISEVEKIKYLSSHDQLTGIFNRRYYKEEINRLNLSRRLPISIVIADIDGLKLVNDKYGHNEGDNYIKTVVGVINNTIRGEDIFARIGGDEFAIVLMETTKNAAKYIVDRINEKIYQINKKTAYNLGVSMGIATKTVERIALYDLITDADNRMYESKKKKKKLQNSEY